MYSCEMSVAAMEEAAAPGMTEDDIWAVLHAENIRRGGEWIEAACWLPDHGQIHGFRNAARGWCRIMKFSPLIRTLSAFTAFAAISRGHGSSVMVTRRQRYRRLQAGTGTYRDQYGHDEAGVVHDLTHNGHHLPEIYQKQKPSCKFTVSVCVMNGR